MQAIEELGRSGNSLSEGLAVAALSHLSKHALADACEMVYQQHLRPLLDEYGGVQEWHLAPLVQVNITAGRLDEAVQYFTQLCSLPSRNAARVVRPSYRIFHMGLQHLAAVEQTLEQARNWIQNRQDQLPIQLINALLKACGQHRLLAEQSELAECVLAKRENYPKPDLATFQILLESCLANARSQESDTGIVSRAQQILQTMRTDFPKIKPDHIIYELLIKLYLQGSDDEANLETAFDYLEEMKHFNMMPSPQIYTALLDGLLLVSKRSDPPYNDARIDLLLQEMASLGYLGGKRHGYSRTKLPTRFFDALGKERINQIRDNFFASRN